MAHVVDFVTVSTEGLESSPVADALAGLRANEARYFANKYDHVLTTEKATSAKGRKLVAYVAKVLEQERGIVKSPVRIGPDCWVGTKVTVLRGSTVGHGCVLAAHAVVRGDIPPMAVAGGAPARVLKDRVEVYEAKAATRAALEDIARKTARAARATSSSA